MNIYMVALAAIVFVILIIATYYIAKANTPKDEPQIIKTENGYRIKDVVLSRDTMVVIAHHYNNLRGAYKSAYYGDDLWIEYNSEDGKVVVKIPGRPIEFIFEESILEEMLDDQ